MKRDREGFITFQDHPEFKPNLTPYEIFEQGAFGGTYWRDIHSTVTGKNYSGQHKKYNWKLSDDLLTRQKEVKSLNKYGVHSGTTLEYWESKGWIKPQDPYGWMQWYCEFYYGRRSEDDKRQIDRWLAFAGKNGRFYKRLINMLGDADDANISPVIHQGLHQWARKIVPSDFRKK